MNDDYKHKYLKYKKKYLELQIIVRQLGGDNYKGSKKIHDIYLNNINDNNISLPWLNNRYKKILDKLSPKQLEGLKRLLDAGLCSEYSERLKMHTYRNQLLDAIKLKDLVIDKSVNNMITLKNFEFNEDAIYKFAKYLNVEEDKITYANKLKTNDNFYDDDALLVTLKFNEIQRKSLFDLINTLKSGLNLTDESDLTNKHKLITSTAVMAIKSFSKEQIATLIELNKHNFLFIVPQNIEKIVKSLKSSQIENFTKIYNAQNGYYNIDIAIKLAKQLNTSQIDSFLKLYIPSDKTPDINGLINVAKQLNTNQIDEFKEIYYPDKPKNITKIINQIKNKKQ